MTLSPLHIEKTVRAALEEDLGHGFDITTSVLLPEYQDTTGRIVARQGGIVSGLIVALSAFGLMSPDFDMTVQAEDGALVESGDILAELHGPAQAMLAAERTALNFLSHMSGIATLTRHFVAEIDGTDARICDTRKTLPGLRAFQKYAVRCGGGLNHRHGLDDAVLIKDNHIAIAGGIAAALDRARKYAGHMVKIEIEVGSLAELDEVIKHGGADVVMLDNMDPETLQKAVSTAKGKLITEASGGISLENAGAVARTGVDYISSGALTHSAPALDIALDIDDKPL